MNYKYTNFSLLDLPIQYTSLQITNLYYTVLPKRETPGSTSGKHLTAADMLLRTFTKKQLQVHQLRHKQVPPQINFSIMKDNQLKPVHYLVKHEVFK